MNLSNRNIDHIKTCNNDSISLKSAYLYFSDFPLFLRFINIHEYASYANVITCIFDHWLKGLCFCINFVQILVIYD